MLSNKRKFRVNFLTQRHVKLDFSYLPQGGIGVRRSSDPPFSIV
jgi:hypothetical protein